ncbi:MAG: glycosyltransferase family 39 protein [Planctomycetes bacterium]|nr:glycosyltransferase family 39 protein [Planctomycetota bacterium]
MSTTARRLAFVLLAALGLRLVLFTGLVGSDDLHYRASARDVLAGKPPVGEFSHSVAPAMAAPMALAYAALGPGEAGTAAWPLVASLAHVLLAFLLGRFLFGEREGLVAAMLMAVYPLEVVLGTQALPDVPIAACAGGAALAFLRGEEARLAGRPCARAFLACGLLIGIGWLAKITCLFVTLFFGLYALVKRRWSKAWGLAAVAFLGVFGAETLFYFAVTGEWFYRLHTIVHTNVVITGPGGYKTSLLEYPFYFFLNPQRSGLFFWVLVPTLIASIVSARHRHADATSLRGDPAIPLLWFAAVFAYLEFGIESWRPLLFIHKEFRFTTLITLPVVLLLAWMIGRLAPRSRLALAGALLATSLPMAAIGAAAHRAPFANVRAIASDLRGESRDVYASYYEAQYLRFLLGPSVESRVHAYNERVAGDRFPVDLSTIRDSIVVVDRETDEGHRARAAAGFRSPPEIDRPPAPWQLVRDYPQRTIATLALVRDAALAVLDVGFVSAPTRERMKRTIERTVEIQPAAIYRVP